MPTFHIKDHAYHMLEKLVAPEVYAYNWVLSKVGPMFGFHHDTVNGVEDYHNLGDNEYRMVDFFAESCPHCVDLAPKWEDAIQNWLAATKGSGSASKAHLIWEKKQCLDGAWKPGADYETCGKENVHAFPTIKFFGPHGEEVQFNGPRSAESLVTFAKQHTGMEPIPEEVGAAGVPSDQHIIPKEDQVVEYYAAACPHCVHLKPVWDEAAASWDSSASGVAASSHHHDVKFVQKECLDADWKPGHDFDDCIKEEVQGFPTIRFEGKNGAVQEYEGDRTVSALHKWTAKQLGEEPVAQQEEIVAQQEEDVAQQEEIVAQQEENIVPASVVENDSGVVAKEQVDETIKVDDSVATAAVVESSSHVVPSEDTLTEYIAASCPHCVRLKPTWEAAASQWSETHQGSPPLKFVQKECLNSDWKPGADFEACMKEDIQGFPAIRFEGKNGVVHEFEGNRTVQGLHSFAEKELGLISAPGDEPPAGSIGLDSVKVADMGLIGLGTGAVAVANYLLQESTNKQYYKAFL